MILSFCKVGDLVLGVQKGKAVARGVVCGPDPANCNKIVIYWLCALRDDFSGIVGRRIGEDAFVNHEFFRGWPEIEN